MLQPLRSGTNGKQDRARRIAAHGETIGVGLVGHAARQDAGNGSGHASAAGLRMLQPRHNVRLRYVATSVR